MKVDHINPVEPDYILKIKASEVDMWDLQDILQTVALSTRERGGYTDDQVAMARDLAAYIEKMLTTVIVGGD